MSILDPLRPLSRRARFRFFLAGLIDGAAEVRRSLRLAARNLFGAGLVECADCGATTLERTAKESGWRWGTMSSPHDAWHAWQCKDCYLDEVLMERQAAERW